MHAWWQRRSELALLAALAAGCAPRAPVPPPAPPAEAVIQRPSLDSSEIRLLAEILMAEDRRQLDSARIGQLLAHPSSEVRLRAAMAIGRIRDAGGAPLLLRALNDSVVDVAAAAAFALGQLGDTSTAVQYALAAKMGTWRGEDDVRAVEAVAALGRLGTPAARAAIDQVLQRYVPAEPQDPSQEDLPTVGSVGREALLAIWRFPRAATTVDLLLPHLASPDDEVRWRATYALMRVASPRAVPYLRLRLTDPNPLVRSLAARGLRAPAVDSALARAETAAALAAALGDEHPHVRINAAAALGTYEDSTLAGSLRGLLGSEDGNVRLAAVQALAAIPGAEAVSTLALVAADTSELLAVRAAALTGAFAAAPQRVAAEAGAWASSQDWLTRLYAARSFAEGRWSDAARPLRRLAEDRDPRVAAAALRAILAAADSASLPFPLFVQSLGAYDPAVRAAAANGLARRASPADLPHLLNAYDRAQADTLNVAALAAIDALAALEQNGAPVSRSFFFRFSPPSDPERRRRIRERLGRGWPDESVAEAPTPPRDLQFYLRVVRDLVVPDLSEDVRPRLEIRTGGGGVTIELAAAAAPLTVHNLISLVESGYFPSDSAAGSRYRWHRVVPNFVLQDGDSRGDGTGGPGYAIRDEINQLRYRRGVVGMALSGPDTGGSQFFITHSPQPHLDGGYTVFGRVIDGMDVADRIVQDDPIHAFVVRR